MNKNINSVEEYISDLDENRKIIINKLREIIKNNINGEYIEKIQYNIISFVIPFSRYPFGYHCNKEQELPFISLASQKNYIALYHMGIYMNKDVLDWFVREYPKYSKTKLDIGKSCIRFKKDIPYDLIELLIQKISVDEYIDSYEKTIKRK